MANKAMIWRYIVRDMHARVQDKSGCSGSVTSHAEPPGVRRANLQVGPFIPLSDEHLGLRWRALSRTVQQPGGGGWRLQQACGQT